MSKSRRYPSLRRRKRQAFSGKFLTKLEKKGFKIVFMGTNSMFGGCLPSLDKKIVFLNDNQEKEEFVPTKEKYTYVVPVFTYNAVDTTFDGVLDKAEEDVLGFTSKVDLENAAEKYLIVYSAYNSKPGDKEQFFCRLRLGVYSIIPLKD